MARLIPKPVGLLAHHKFGVHPLDIPVGALTTVTWWDAMQWTADVLEYWSEDVLAQTD